MVSSTSSGFLSPGGTTAPNESFAAQSPTIKSAGSQKYICANQGSAARALSSFAVHHWYAPYAPVPSSGEIAIPVTVEIAPAIDAPGERSLLVGTALRVVDGAARANGTAMADNARMSETSGRKRLMKRRTYPTDSHLKV
jgi:hypothetical protein